MKNVLSFNVAKNKSVFLLTNSDNELLIGQKKYEHTENNFNELKESIEALSLDNLTVIM